MAGQNVQLMPQNVLNNQIVGPIGTEIGISLRKYHGYKDSVKFFIEDQACLELGFKVMELNGEFRVQFQLNNILESTSKHLYIERLVIHVIGKKGGQLEVAKVESTYI